MSYVIVAVIAIVVGFAGGGYFGIKYGKKLATAKADAINIIDKFKKGDSNED